MELAVVNINQKSKRKDRGTKMSNEDIRDSLGKHRLFYYELAMMLNISEFTLSRKLRRELPDDEKKRVLSVIETASKDVSVIGLSKKTMDCLKNCGIETVLELCEKTADDLLKIRGFDEKSLNEVIAALEHYNLHLIK